VFYRKTEIRTSSSDYGFVRDVQGQNTRTTVSYEVYKQLKAANQTLNGLLACAPVGVFNVIQNGNAELNPGMEVSGNYFAVLGITPLKGRLLTDADDTP